ncbi:MAG: branched chain amino acid aminotransferase, partial [Erythrobacter sp.]|nr:branched chain amino acid aminotransferase [Erythrobacter sp.]
QWREEATSGELLETLACGTAAVVTPVGTVASPDGEFTIGTGGIGQMATKMRTKLVDIQHGRHTDSHGWVIRV